MTATALPIQIHQRPMKRVLSAILGSTLFGLTAATAVRAEPMEDFQVTEDIAFSGYVAGVVLPLDETVSAKPAAIATHVPVATPDGFFMDDAMDDAAYRAMLDDIQMQQFILVGGIDFQPTE
ncbi:MAG: hypothetical protein JNM76_18405 [Betaproteobacteria bacterium]|nr:hypothetical protein [Betaproteobacteria bacterium]